jgi:hypothetical protein
MASKVGHVYQRKIGHAKNLVMSARRGIAQAGIGHPPIKVNRGLDALGLGLSVASGVVAAAGFGGYGVKGFAASQGLAHAIDVGGVAANAAAVAGRGQAKDRIMLGAKMEARNFIIGNAIYGAGVIGLKRNRQAMAGVAKKTWEIGQKAINWARGFKGATRLLTSGAV